MMNNVITINNVQITTLSSSNNVHKTTQLNNDNLPINVFIENVNNKVSILHIHGHNLTYAYLQKLLRYIEQHIIPQLNHDMVAICTNLQPYYIQQVSLLLNNYNYVVGYYDLSTSTMYFRNFTLIYTSHYGEQHE